MKQPNRRRMRGTLGSRTNRRSGTKTARGHQLRPNARLKQLIARYERGGIDENGRER